MATLDAPWRALRGGSTASRVVLGGQRIAVRRLRARSMDETLARHQLWAQGHGHHDVPVRAPLPKRPRQCHALSFFAGNKDVTGKGSMLTIFAPRPRTDLPGGTTRKELALKDLSQHERRHSEWA